MLTLKQATAVGAEVARLYYNHRRDTTAVNVRSGWFPLNLDEIIQNVVNPPTPKNPIEFRTPRDTRDILVVRVKGLTGKISIRVANGDLHVGDWSRSLPKEYGNPAMDDLTLEAQADGTSTLHLNLNP